MTMIEERKEEILNHLAEELLVDANQDFQAAHNAAGEGLDEIKRLLLNHTEVI